MPKAQRNIDVWRHVVQQQQRLPTRRMWRTVGEVPNPHSPRYCYLTLFKEQYHNAFDWPKYLTWAQIVEWNEELREEGQFRITKALTMWHIERVSEGKNTWVAVEQMVIGRYVNESVGILVWTMEMAWRLAQALIGHQYWFGQDVPQPMEVPAATPPEGLLPHQEEMYRAARQERIDHNAAVETGRNETAEHMGQLLAQVVNELKPDKESHPQLKLEMPEHYEGDPAEIDNWLRSMETYFTLTNVTDLK